MIARSHRAPNSAWLSVAGLFVLASALSAQTPVRVEEDAECRGHSSRYEQYCEVREYRLDALRELRVDSGVNGGIRVTGWDRDEIRVVARIQANTRTGDPRALAREIDIRVGPTIETDGPRMQGSRGGWSVSYELEVPRATALRLRASNGGIGLEGLTGDVNARTTNGGIRLVGGAGNVQGETTNGGVHIELLGSRWQGAGVDLQTTNGGVEIILPRDYSADLETGTVNGGMRIDVPITVQGRIDRRIRTQLGEGGPLIRALTTNGGIVIRN